MMAAEEVLRTAEAAYEQKRPLSGLEWNDVRRVLNDPTTSPKVRGALDALSDEITKQADAEMRRQQREDQETRAREHERAMAERASHWEKTDLMACAMYLAQAHAGGRPATVREVLAQYENALQAGRGRAPFNFEGEILPEYQRSGMAGVRP